MFSEAVLTLPEDIRRPLETAGWFPGRKINVDQWIEYLEAEGHKPFPVAREFLEVFGGLKLNAVPIKERAFNPGKSFFDPIRAGGEIDRIEGWEEDNNLRLFPIGWVFNSYWVLLISPECKFYAGSDETFAVVGNNLEEALRMMLYAPSQMEVLNS